MIFVVLRARGEKINIDRILGNSHFVISHSWRKGEISNSGEINKDSGFNLSIADEESWSKALPIVRSWFQSSNGLLQYLSSYDADIVLDIGVTVGEESSYTNSVDVPCDLLTILVSNGVSLSVSSYPAMEETQP